MHSIEKKPGHLVVTIKGEASFEAVVQAIQEEMARDDYPHSNDIFLLEKCVPALSLAQLEAIAAALALHYPKDATRTKTAIVTAPGFLKGIAEVWAASVASLPFETRVLTSLQEAEEWISEGFRPLASDPT